jgi:glycosyltransferase involved in cell wall biosynthesis
MRTVHISYVSNASYTDPEAWLKRIDFFTGILEASTEYSEVMSIHCVGYSGVIEKGGVTYHFLKLNKFQLLFPWFLHQYVKRLSPDVVIVHSLNFPQNVLLLRLQLPGVKILVYYHAERLLRFPRTFIQRVADNFIEAYLFTVTELAEPWLKARLIKNERKIKEVLEGSSVFSPVDRTFSNEKTSVRGRPVYLWVGRLNQNKDPVPVIRAFAEFSGQFPTASLYMIYHTEELLGEIRFLISLHSSLERSVHLIGKVDHNDMVYWYNSADFFILGSRHEGTAISVAEAMSCGCVPILSDIPPFKGMTKKGQCGLHYSVGNALDLLKTLVKSTQLDLPLEREKTLDVFKTNHSFAAIAKSIYKTRS